MGSSCEQSDRLTRQGQSSTWSPDLGTLSGAVPRRHLLKMAQSSARKIIAPNSSRKRERHSISGGSVFPMAKRPSQAATWGITVSVGGNLARG